MAIRFFDVFVDEMTKLMNRFDLGQGFSQANHRFNAFSQSKLFEQGPQKWINGTYYVIGREKGSLLVVDESFKTHKSFKVLPIPTTAPPPNILGFRGTLYFSFDDALFDDLLAFFRHALLRQRTLFHVNDLRIFVETYDKHPQKLDNFLDSVGIIHFEREMNIFVVKCEEEADGDGEEKKKCMSDTEALEYFFNMVAKNFVNAKERSARRFFVAKIRTNIGFAGKHRGRLVHWEGNQFDRIGNAATGEVLIIHRDTVTSRRGNIIAENIFLVRCPMEEEDSISAHLFGAQFGEYECKATNIVDTEMLDFIREANE